MGYYKVHLALPHFRNCFNLGKAVEPQDMKFHLEIHKLASFLIVSEMVNQDFFVFWIIAEKRMKMGSSRLKNRLLARLFTAFPSLAERWGRRLEAHEGDIPWAVPEKPLREAVLALVTTGGVHLSTHPPFDMADPNGDPTFREVPVDMPRARLTITHDYYDHRDAERDMNLVFPAQRLKELAEAGALGGLHPMAYSFMGHIAGPHLKTLQAESAPEVARRLADAKVDYALLVPA